MPIAGRDSDFGRDTEGAGCATEERSARVTLTRLHRYGIKTDDGVCAPSFATHPGGNPR